jgi:hypothetical protein
MTETEWTDLVNNTKEKLKKKTREALDRALEAKTLDPKTDTSFQVVLSDDGKYHIVNNGERDFYYGYELIIFKFKTTDEDLEYYDKNFDFLFDNIWLPDILFFLDFGMFKEV